MVWSSVLSTEPLVRFLLNGRWTFCSSVCKSITQGREGMRRTQSCVRAMRARALAWAEKTKLKG
ncbi:hypothetical protein CORC01_12734 [Colletotrichum orchidophilum]|uniref:Uncharacterized protein n=1 Tax=Colletotrichum orchidophilum TaxID=1209926 RepID=A0A1G4AS60_9PEZI|nr:uncharacterized protein CORC01_12734 [Colletotrichum orchidophilum]OHE91946.1 hypothetical protein CORC01_12734 [Colletotrichum orchidophilum]